MSTSADGSVKGKKLGRKRTLIFSPKRRLRKYSSVPLRWAKVTPSSTTRPSTWKNIGSVGRVGRLPAEDLARDDDPDGRLALLHDPDLDGRGVGPEQQVVVDVERVPVVAGRVVGREVEGLEIVVIGLDLRPVLDGEAHVRGRSSRSPAGRGASGWARAHVALARRAGSGRAAARGRGRRPSRSRGFQRRRAGPGRRS